MARQRGLGYMHLRDPDDTTPVTDWIGLRTPTERAHTQPEHVGVYERLGLCNFLSFWDGTLWYDLRPESGTPGTKPSPSQALPWRGRDLDTMYKHHLTSHFSGCRLLAETHDTHRNREVHVYALPGEFEVVGVSDGTDAWIAPVAINPFSIDVRRILGELRNGEDPAVVHRDNEAGAPRTRRQFKDAEQSPEPEPARPQRRQVAETAPQGVEQKRVRRSLHV